MSSIVTAPPRSDSGPGAEAPLLRVRGRGISADLLAGTGLAIVLIVVAFAASGGVDLAPNTWTQAALVVIADAVLVAIALLSPTRPLWGGASVLLFAGLAALTYASIGWSVQPSNSWLEANRTLSYLGAFAAAAGIARLWPGRWRALIGAVGTGAALICLYALITKVFPATLDPTEPLARLSAPFDYWNAVGLMAAMGIPAAVWAGARRESAPALRALSVPAIAILIPALLLSYSRGALIVGAIGVAFWFALVPLRLRGAAILAAGSVPGALISAWALSSHGLTAEDVALSARTAAGHSFGVVLLVALVLTAALGFGVAYAIDRASLPAQTRRRIGTALIVLVGLIPVAGVVALAASSRGLTGQVSHIWHTLTNQNGVVGNEAGRLIQLSNSRPHYWGEALKVGEHHLLAGAGAVGFSTAQGQYASGVWSGRDGQVDHAHGYLLQTFADFGLIGVVLTLALFVAWVIAAGRSLGLRRPPRLAALRAPPAEHAAEQTGLLTLAAIVLIFGLHSLIDWTWFVPGTAVLALVCAGWLAGRGPLAQPVGRLPKRRRLSRSPAAAALVGGALIVAVIAIWVIVQPLRSADAYDAALTQVTRGNTAAALTDARRAQAANPVSIDPLWLQSAIYQAAGNPAAARRALVKATSVQPSNPQSWARLGCYDLTNRRTSLGVAELLHAGSLSPAIGAAVRADGTAFCASIDG